MGQCQRVPSLLWCLEDFRKLSLWTLAGFVLWAPGWTGGRASTMSPVPSPRQGLQNLRFPLFQEIKVKKQQFLRTVPLQRSRHLAAARPALWKPCWDWNCRVTFLKHFTWHLKPKQRHQTWEPVSHPWGGLTSFTPRSRGDSQCLSAICPKHPASCATPVLPGLPSLAPQGSRPRPPRPCRSPQH